MINSSTNIVTSFKDKEGNEIVFTGKNAHITEFVVNQPSPKLDDVYNLKGDRVISFMPQEPITITLEATFPQHDKNGNANYILESSMNGFKPKRKISQLKVEDCTIKELLFAIRKKLK